MARLLQKLLRVLRERHGTDMLFMCRLLLSERGEASQTALAQEIINTYRIMNASQRRSFFEMLCSEFSPDRKAIHAAAANYEQTPSPEMLAELFEAVEPPRQELIRRINTAPQGTGTLVAIRENLLSDTSHAAKFAALDADLKHLFKSWFNRGFLRLERISWQTSALLLEKLIRYESVHEIHGWHDLHRRLESDRRCFAFFHPALMDEPIIFVEVALSKGLPGNVEPLLDVHGPVLPAAEADTAVFYSINNCLRGLRGVPFGSFLIKQVVTELAAEFPNIKNYGTLSPLPRFSRALRDNENEEGFTRERLSGLLTEFARELMGAAKRRDPVDALYHLLEHPLAHREILSKPLERLALAYLTRARQNGRLYDPVAIFHLANGARLERIFAFGNSKPYGIEASFGVTVNYRYLPAELEENHERFIRKGQIRVSDGLFREHKHVAAVWQTAREMPRRAKTR